MILVTMRSAFIFTLIFTLVFGTSYWYVETASICPAPITYRLGELDNRFKINQETAKKVFLEAEMVWEQSVGRELFVYDEGSDFAINFIYDERQQLASTEEEWRINLDRQELESQKVIEQVKTLWEKYNLMQDIHKNERIKYDEKLAVYNKKVSSINEQGGATKTVFAELESEKNDLINLLNNLVDSDKDLNRRAEEINELGEEGNRLIEKYNAEVLKYNEIYGNIDLYTQGDFQRDRINIYKFNDEIELRKAIAHEFGHALGIGHVEGEESIMYYLMADQPDSTLLSEEDKQEFINICGDGTGFAQELRRIIRKALTYL